MTYIDSAVTSLAHRQVPWNGGTLANDPRTAFEIGLDGDLLWEPQVVRIDSMHTSHPFVEYGPIVSDQVLLMRREGFAEQRVLGVHSEKYGVLGNHVGVGFVEEILDLREDAHVESVVQIGHGRKVFVVIRFDDTVGTTRHNGADADYHQSYMAVCWSHDGSWALSVKYLRYEGVCANIFTPGNTKTGLSVRHTSNAVDRAAEARRAVDGLVTSMADLDERIAKLQEYTLGPGAFSWYAQRVLGSRPAPTERYCKASYSRVINDRKGKNWDKRYDAIHDEFDDYTDGETAYDFVMAVQGYEQHRQRVRGDRSERLIDRLVGDEFPLTDKAFALFA